MPEFVPIPLVAHVAIRGTIGGEQCQNGLYFKNLLEPWSSASLGSFLTYINDWWTDIARLWLPSHYQFLELFAADQSSATGPVATLTAATPWTGLRTTGGPMPNSTTFAIAFRTGLRGRGNQGRNFWPGFVKNDVIDNEIALGAAEGIKDAYEMLTPVGGAIPPTEVQWVVVSRYFNGAPRITGTSTLVLEASYRDRIVDSQRRRLPGRGA